MRTVTVVARRMDRCGVYSLHHLGGCGSVQILASVQKGMVIPYSAGVGKGSREEGR